MSKTEQAAKDQYQRLICFKLSRIPGEYQTYFPLSEFRKALNVLEDAGVDHVKQIVIQELKTPDSGNKIFILCDNKKGIVDQATDKLRRVCTNVESDVKEVPWFPMHIGELDHQANDVFPQSTTSTSDHPSSRDDEYKARRDSMIDKHAKRYKHGDKLKRIKYTDEEIKTWESVYKNLEVLWQQFAIKEHKNRFFNGLQKECCLSGNSIPQLEEVSSFLKSSSGFTLRPAAGLIRSRQFLAGFAFRVFHCNQPIRHKDRPDFSPEPDICHEILGHAALLSDPSFAEFLQEIGLASLGASDDDIKKLMRVYFYIIEFGLCKEGDDTKALGAGLLSSYGELQHSCNEADPKVIIVDFSTAEAVDTKIAVTDYQRKYFRVNSFRDAKDKLREYARSIEKPFKIDYDATTESVNITYF